MVIAVRRDGAGALRSGRALADVAAVADAWGLLAGAIAVGATVGALLAARVAMTSMPELVAILHSFVGAAAVLVGIANYLEPGGRGRRARCTPVEIVVGVFIGAVTFTRLGRRVRQAARHASAASRCCCPGGTC